MKWIKDTGKKAMPFLMKKEWAHVNLNEKVLHHQKHTRLSWNRDNIWILTDQRSVAGVFWFRPGGYLLPTFDESIKECPPLPVRTDNIRGIMATEKNLNVIKKQLPEPDRPQKFKIMIHDGSPNSVQKKITAGIYMELADSTHWKELYPMELAYQKEEVYGSNRNMDDHVIALGLRRTLRIRDVFIIKRNGVVIGKANTNSSGRIWDQIGGVYIMPEYRNQGYATLLMRHINTCMNRKNRKLSLFVKTANISAVNLYKSCGFTDKGSFHLGYYNSPADVQ